MSTRINSYLKTIFFVIIIFNLLPSFLENISKHWEDNIDPKNKIGYLVINDTIYSSTKYIKHLHSFFKNPEIKAIILKLDSPGGASGSSQAIMQEIEILKSKYPKPIVSYIENICASGAFYIASATDHIVSTSGAVVGSIGCRITTQFKVKQLLEQYNIHTETISSGKHKVMLDPFSEMTAEHRQALQNMSNDMYNQFVSDIAERRHLPIETSEEWADGKVFSGNQAHALKLVDKIGNLSTAIEFIKKHIIPGSREVELVEVQQKSKLDKWFGSEEESLDLKIQQTLQSKFVHNIVQYFEQPRITSF